MTITENRLRDALSAAAATTADLRPLIAPARRRSRLPVALAAVATVAAVGTGFLWVRQAAPQGTVAEVALASESRGKIAVFLCKRVDPFPKCHSGLPEKAVIAEALRSMPEVESVTFEDSGQAYLNFKRQFKGDAELVKAITEKDLPESFRVLPRPDADRKRIVEAAEKMPGVSNVIDPRCPVPLARFILPRC